MELKDFDVYKIMGNIKAKMPFYNERHFQFELALAIKDYFKDNKDIEIAFEAYYGAKKGDVESDSDSISKIEKRKYTDIVVYDKTSCKFIAIELKYALDDKNSKNGRRFEYNVGNNTISIAKKGAIDNCRYDFLYDVHRLEEIKNNPQYENQYLKHYYRGCAIIISNAEKIWTKYSKNTKDINFHIADNTYTKTECNWTGGINHSTTGDGINDNGKKISRNKFALSKTYHCQWMPKDGYYFDDDNKKSPPFKYLVIEV